MFTRKSARAIFASLILGYIFLYIIRLYIAGKIELYVHPRYVAFIVVMSLLAIVMLVIGAFYSFRHPSHASKAPIAVRWTDTYIIIIVVLAFVLPAKTLSTRTIGERGIIVPTPGQSRTIQHCPSEPSTNIRSWVFQLSEYPVDCHDGQPIELVGHILNSPSAPLPANTFYFGRVVISCCVIDARPYAIPAYSDSPVSFDESSWLRLAGTLRLTEVNNQPQFVIDVESLNEIADPARPYEYLNVPSYITQPELTPKTAP